MPPDLPEKLLGIDIDPAADRQERDRSDRDEAEERVRFVVFGVGEHRLAVPVDDVLSSTDLPEDLTRVPRTPDAIEGVTDLRGEITAVIDPTIYFPTSAAPSDHQQLLVFDSPDDQQSAALRVDDVRGVESVPERDVLQTEDLESRPVSGDALEHPLVTALVERTRRTRRADVTAEQSAAEATGGGSAVASSVGRRRTVVELIPVIDVDDLLSASGHLVSTA